jgi:integrase
MVRIPIHPAIDWIRIDPDPYPGIRESYHKQVATVSHQFEKILTRAKVTGGKIGIHSLRTTFITCCEQSGIPRSLVQGMVGHSAGSMTGHYSEATASEEMIRCIRVVAADQKNLS